MLFCLEKKYLAEKNIAFKICFSVKYFKNMQMYIIKIHISKRVLYDLVNQNNYLQKTLTSFQTKRKSFQNNIIFTHQAILACLFLLRYFTPKNLADER